MYWPAVHGDGSGEAGLLLVGERVLHQAEDAVGGAGHEAALRLLARHRPLGVGEVGQAQLLAGLQ